MFENVQFFSHLHFKVCEQCNYDPQKIVREKYQYGIKNRRIYADFKFFDADLKVLTDHSN